MLYLPNVALKGRVMPINKVFDRADIQALINMNSKPPYQLRNAMIIITGVFQGLTPLEQSRLMMMDVLTEQGALRGEININSQLAYNDVPRTVPIADHLKPTYEAYLEWLKANLVYQSGCDSFRGFSATGAFIVNDNFKPYPLIKRSQGGALSPNAMNKKIMAMIKNTGIEGARVSTLRDSWIKQMYDHGCQIKELMAVSGIRTKKTIDQKIKPTSKELYAVINDIYSRVKL